MRGFQCLVKMSINKIFSIFRRFFVEIPNTKFDMFLERFLAIWAASSEFGTYRLCKQRRFRRACASARSRQNLRYSLIQAVSQEEPSDRKQDPWRLWMTGHAQLKFVMTECSKTQIRLTRSICKRLTKIRFKNWNPKNSLNHSYLGRVKRICVFEHSVMTNFNYVLRSIIWMPKSLKCLDVLSKNQTQKWENLIFRSN